MKSAPALRAFHRKIAGRRGRNANGAKSSAKGGLYL